MPQSVPPGRFGHSGKPDAAWLAKQEQEPILEPALPIIDTHHHLWDGRGRWTYLLSELLADLNAGHNIVATVFEECPKSPLSVLCPAIAPLVASGLRS